MRILATLWRDDRGYLLTAESIFMATLLVIGLVAGWKAVNQSVNNELEDVANAIGSLDQSYRFGGVKGCCAETRGSLFADDIVHSDVDTCVRNIQDAVDGCEDDG